MPFPIKARNVENIEYVLNQLTHTHTIDRILTTPKPKNEEWKKGLDQKFDLNEEKRKDMERAMEEKKLEYARLSLPEIIKRVVEFDPTSSKSIKYICGNDYSNFVD